MQVPIDFLRKRFLQLKTADRDVVVTSRLGTKLVDLLYPYLSTIESAWSSAITLKEYLNKVPEIFKIIETHCVMTPYSMSAQKCVHEGWCGVIRSPKKDKIRELSMHRHPTPRFDTRIKGHFLNHEEALAIGANKSSALTDLTNLPSDQIGKVESTKALAKANAKRDVTMARDLGLKSWEVKRVCSIIVCSIIVCLHCGNRRCICSPTDVLHRGELVAFQKNLDSVSSRCSCGDILFDDYHHLSKTILQKKSLTCATPIEKGYFNDKEIELNLKDVCYHCGELELTMFLLGRDKFRQKSITDGWNCYPIFQCCISNGKKPGHSGKQNKMLAKKEKIAKQAIALVEC